MLNKVCVLWSLILLVSISGLVSAGEIEMKDEDHALVKVYLTNTEQSLQPLIMDIDLIEFQPDYLKAFATREQIAAFEKMGLKTEMLDMSEVVDTSTLDKEDAGLYHTYAEVAAELQQIESAHSDIAKVYDIGDSIEGRDILAIKISDNVTIEEAGEANVLYMGCHHAREWISVEIPMYLTNFLVDNYGTDPTITKLVDERQTWIVPIVNPDGLEYSQNVYTMWRKNKRDNDNDGVFERNFDGVDNNRNYGYKWGYDNIGSSPNPSDETYRGAYAFSEPENQAIRDLALQHDFVFAITYHSYGEQMIYPWGYIDADTPDHKLFTDVAAKMAQWNGYTYGNPKDGIIYNTNGDATDWLYGDKGTIAYTFELGTEFIPPENLIDDIWFQNRGASLYLLQIADDPHQIYPSIRIYTDKTDYSKGDTMEVGLNLTNPHDAINVGVYVWVDLPSGGKHLVFQKPNVNLPAGYSYSNPAWKTYVLPTLQLGNYSWHAAIIDPATRYVLNESVSEWTFNLFENTGEHL